LGAFMRHFMSLLVAGSSLALVSVLGVPSQAATALNNKAETQIASVSLEQQPMLNNQTKVVCSRNHPLASEGVTVASGIAPQSADWAPNVIKLFCRDVRINTIVVRDYCALIRQ
jgi:hypothetical protein